MNSTPHSAWRICNFGQSCSNDAIWVFAFLSLFLTIGCVGQEIPDFLAAKPPTLSVETEHAGAITTFAYSRDGKYLASGSDNGSVKLRDARDGRVLRTFWQNASVQSITFTPDGCCLAAAGDEAIVRIWNLIDGNESRRVLAGWPKQILFSHDGKMLIAGESAGKVGDERSSIEIMSTQTGKRIKSLSAKVGNFGAMALSPDDRALAVGGWGTIPAPPEKDQIGPATRGTVQIWDLQRGEVTRTLEGHSAPVSAVAFSVDGSLIASGDWKSQVKIWEVATGAERESVVASKIASVIHGLTFTKQGQGLAVCSSELSELDTENGKLQRQLDDDSCAAIAVSPDQGRLASAFLRGFKLFDLHDPSGTLAVDRPMVLKQAGLWPMPLGHKLITVDEEGCIAKWDLRSGEMHLLDDRPFHCQWVSKLATPDGAVMAGWGSTTETYVYDSAGRRLREIQGSIATASADGKQLAIATENEITIWELLQWRKIRSIPEHVSSLATLCISADHKLLAVGDDDGARFYDLTNGKKVGAFVADEDSSVRHIAFSPNGRIAVLGVSDGIALYDIAHKRSFFTASLGTINALAFSPDGAAIAIADRIDGQSPKDGPKNALLLFDVASRQIVRRFAEPSEVTDLAFSHDGLFLYSAASDGAVHLWNPSTGALSATILAFKRGIEKASGASSADWALIDANGDVEGTAGALQSISIRKAHEAISSITPAPRPNLFAKITAESAPYKSIAPVKTRTGQAACHSASIAVKYPELVPQLGHEAPVYAVAMAPDGSWFTSSSQDSIIKFWTRNGIELRSVFADQGFITGLSISPNAKLLASSGQAPGVKLWNVSSGLLVRTLTGQVDSTFGLAFSPDGRILASASSDRTLSLWDPSTGRELNTMASDPVEPLMAVRFSPDGRQIAAAGKHIYVWSVGSGKQILALSIEDASESTVIGLTISPDGKWLAAGQGKQLRIWRIPNGEQHAEIAVAADINGIDFSPDSKQIVVSTAEKLYLGSIDGNAVDEISEDGAFNSARFTPDGKLLIVSTERGIWGLDVASRKQIFSVPNASAPLAGAGFANNGRLFAVATQTGSVVSWNIDDGNAPQVVHTIDPRLNSSDDDARYLGAIAFDPNHKMALAQFSDLALEKWNLDTGKQVGSFPERGPAGISPMVLALPMSLANDGSRLVAISAKGDMQIYRVENRHLIHSFDGENLGIVAVDGDGGKIVAASNRELKLFDSETGDLIRTFSGHNKMITRLAVSSNGRWIASSSEDRTVQLWDINSGEAIHYLSGQCDRVTGLAFNADSTLVASGGSEGTAQLWEVASGRLVRTLVGGLGPLGNLSFSPDGNVLLATLPDGIAMLWNVASGKLLATVYVSSDASQWLVISPDGEIDGSNTVLKSLAWRRSSNFKDVELSRGAASLRPGLLQSILKSAVNGTEQRERTATAGKPR